MHKRFLPLFSVVVLAGCVSGPDYRTPETVLSQEWPEHELFSEARDADWQNWWTRFGDPVLDELVARALDQNLEIRLQALRVEEFRARLGLARAEQLPTVEVQASASRERVSGVALGIPEAGSSTNNIFAVSGVLGYEIDLWGRLVREREAAEAILRENEFARDAVRLSIIADVAATYFDLRAARSQVAITRETIESRAETLRLQQIRREGGDIDELALQQARSEWETARAELPVRLQRQRVLEGAFGILLGFNPAELWEEIDLPPGDLANIDLPESVPALLPSELLERRPDIRAAEASLMAATARIGVARAERFPRLNLATLLGTAANTTGDLFGSSATTWSAGASLAGPIWGFGRGRARVETAEAIAEQSEVQYHRTVNVAFTEVRDALVFYETSGERRAAIRRLVASLERTEELAQLRYDEGFISFMELLDTQRALLSARLGLEEAIRDQLTATATLFKTLGGGWVDAGDADG